LVLEWDEVEAFRACRTVAKKDSHFESAIERTRRILDLDSSAIVEQ
jgi:hypothetical protein